MEWESIDNPAANPQRKVALFFLFNVGIFKTSFRKWMSIAKKIIQTTQFLMFLLKHYVSGGRQPDVWI